MAPSITTWTRLEPSTRRTDLADSLAARVLDPLWLLTRQWQVAEFQAEDAGTPIVARVRADNAMLSRIHLGELAPNTMIQADGYDPRAAPLEVMVEQRAARPSGPDDLRSLRFSVDAGLQLVRTLAGESISGDYRAAFIAHYALAEPGAAVTPDQQTARFLQLMAGRAVDARKVYQACRSGSPATVAADPALGVSAGDRAEVRDALTAWVQWYASFFAEPAAPEQDAWVADRLEYQVSVAGRLSEDPMDEVTLTATEFGGGYLEWSSFDINAEVNTGTAGDHTVTAVTQTALPAPVKVRGGPAQRFWQVENGTVDYGRIAGDTTDLVHLMLTEYISSYGNDWFVVPLTLPVGSLTRVTSLVVTDTFGARTLLRPIGDRSLPAPQWSMWQMGYLQRPGSDAPTVAQGNLFFLPPSLSRAIDGPVLEEVLFMRDEMANVAWAIERVLETPLEAGASSAEPPIDPADAGSPGPPDTGDSGIPSRYLLSTRVPHAWVPLLPVELTGADGVLRTRLQRGAVLSPDGSNQVHSSHSDVLAGSPPPLLYDEEVPREGIRVARARRSARWIDGSSWLWAAERTQVGRGEGSSGLRFDSLNPGEGGLTSSDRSSPGPVSGR